MLSWVVTLYLIVSFFLKETNVLGLTTFNKFLIDLIFMGLCLFRVATIIAIRKSIKKFSFVLCLGVTLLVSIAILNSNAPLNFMLVELRPVIFLVLLTLWASNKTTQNSLKYIKKDGGIILTFFILYAYMLIAGYERREMFILREQNFELMVLVFFIIFNSLRNGIKSKAKIFTIFTTLFIAQSVSAVGAATSGYVLLQRSKLIKILVGSLLAIGFSTVIYSRFSEISSFSNIDRIVYIILFYSEILQISSFQLLFGNGIVELSVETCNHLSYFDQFFYEGRCYPVIFHMNILRTIFCYGVVGFFLIYYMLWYAIRTIFISTGISLAIYVTLIISGLSVSGYGNGFVFLILALILNSKNHLMNHKKL